MVWKTIRSEDVDAAKLHCCLLSQNTFKCERDLSLMLMDWLILLLQKTTPLITSTSWPFHISCSRRSSRRALASAKRDFPARRPAKSLCCVPGTQCVSSVGVTANSIFSAGSNMVNPNSDHELTFSQPRSSSDATLLQIILLYLSHNAILQTSPSSPPSCCVLSSSYCFCI